MQVEELVQLCEKALDLSKQRDKLNDELMDVEKRLRDLEQGTIPELMVGMGLDSFEVQGRRYTLKKSYKARLTEQKVEAALKFLADNGFDSVIKAQLIAEVGATDTDSVLELISMIKAKGMEAHLKNVVHPNTLAAFVKERDAEGQLTEEMVDLLSVHEMYKVSVKKEKSNVG